MQILVLYHMIQQSTFPLFSLVCLLSSHSRCVAAEMYAGVYSCVFWTRAHCIFDEAGLFKMCFL